MNSCMFFKHCFNVATPGLLRLYNRCFTYDFTSDKLLTGEALTEIGARCFLTVPKRGTGLHTWERVNFRMRSRKRRNFMYNCTGEVKGIVRETAR